jgi:hypothetical protein
MFNCSAKDGKTQLISIQGSYSHGGSNDISGIVFRNYDNDTKQIFDMSCLTMQDDTINQDFDGYGSLVFKTKAGISNVMTEAMRIKYDQKIGIGTIHPSEKLTINNGNVLIEGSNNGLIITNNSNKIELFTINNTANLFFNSNLIIGKYNNSNSITSNLTINNDGSIDIFGNTKFHSNININNLTLYTNESNLLSIDINSNLHTFNPLTTKGDLLIHSGITETRLPIGDYNQILISDSNETNGLKWKNLSYEIGDLNPNYTKIFNCTSQNKLILTTEYQDIKYENIDLTINEYISISNDSEIEILQTDKYLITFSVNSEINNLNSITDFTQITTQFLIDTGNGYIELDASQTDTINYPIETNISNSSITFVLNLNANTKLKTQIKNNNQYISVNTMMNNVNINILKIKSNCQYISLYKNINQSISTTYSDIIWNNERYIDNNYTLNNSEINIISDGVYIIIANIGFIQTSSSDYSYIETRILCNNIEITESLSYTSICNNGFKNNVNCNFIKFFNTNSILKLQSKIISGNNIEINQFSTNFNIIKINDTVPRYFSGYLTEQINIPTSFIDLPINNILINDEIYNYNNSEIEILESGTYIIFCKVSLENLNNFNSVCRIRIRYNTNNIGYEKINNNLSGCLLYGYGVYSPNIHFISYFQKNTKLKLQIVSCNINQNFQTILNSTTMDIVKISDSINNNYLLKSFYQELVSLEETSTNSNDFINKIVLITKYLYNGNYNISVSYSIHPQSSNNDITVQVLLNKNVIYTNNISNFNNNQSINQNILKYFNEGNHQIQLQFKSNNSNIVMLYNCKIALYRII